MFKKIGREAKRVEQKHRPAVKQAATVVKAAVKGGESDARIAATINNLHRDGYGDIHYAVLNGDQSALQAKIDDDRAKLDLMTECNENPEHHKKTALQLAVDLGRLDMAQKLLDGGAAGKADPNHLNTIGKDGLASIHRAAADGSVERLNFLLAQPTVDRVLKTQAPASCGANLSALQVACRAGHIEVAEMLQAAFGDTITPEDAMTFKSFTASLGTPLTDLHVAVIAEEEVKAQKLLNAPETQVNAPVRDKTNQFYTQTALQIAVNKGFLPIADILLQDSNPAGRANPKHLNDLGPTGLACIHYAAADANNKTIQYLVKIPEVICDLPTADGKSPVKVACENGHINTAFLLLSAIKDEQHRRPQDVVAVYELARDQSNDVVTIALQNEYEKAQATLAAEASPSPTFTPSLQAQQGANTNTTPDADAEATVEFEKLGMK